MSLAKKTAATIAATAALIVTPFAASSVVTSAAPEPVRAVAAAVALPEAEAAAESCRLYKVDAGKWAGGCRNALSRVVVKCVDGSRVKWVQSSFGRGHHSAWCNPGGIPWGFYKAESAYLRFL